MVDFYIKRGDTLDAFDATLKGADDVAVDLTGATARFTMTNVATGVNKVTGAAMTLVDAAGGKVRYEWQAADTDTAGDYYGEVEVTFASGKVATFPNSRHLVIRIQEALA